MRLQTNPTSAENVLLSSLALLATDLHHEARRLPEFSRFDDDYAGPDAHFKTARRQTQAPVVFANPTTAFCASRRFVETIFRALRGRDVHQLVEPIKQASRSGEKGLLRDVWYSKLRASKLPSTWQSLRMIFRVLQGTHKHPVQPPSSTKSIGTDPNLSQRAYDAGMTLRNTSFHDAMCPVEAELGRRILDNLDPVLQATDACSVVATVVAFLQKVTTQDTLDMGTEAWKKTTTMLLHWLWQTLRAQNRYTSQPTAANNEERIQRVESALDLHADMFREPAIAKMVRRAATRFPKPSVAIRGPTLLLRVVFDGLTQVDPPLRSVHMTTWSARRAHSHRVLRTIVDGGQFPSLNRLVCAFRQAAAGSDQRIRNLLGIAELPSSIVWAIGRQAFQDLLDVAMRIETSVNGEYRDVAWRAPARVEPIGAQAAVDQDDECAVCAEAWSPQELAALGEFCKQFKTESDIVTSRSVRRLSLQRSGLEANYCGHFFHKSCMSQWAGPCPLCRAKWLSSDS
ncbi:MAG: hypothetical protein KVP17_000720 [Porospora cf. gigantea B]|uniref:uncharacterized protein n=1 Tax=Porospora cf. gigantea B TaxID=2853592 RepID=UPI00357181EF|nr:MAG: hypothetical protein KVP17_000720 [Porospora cf. gigantea B]